MGILLLAILATSAYVIFNNNLKINVTTASSTFYVKNGTLWLTSGVEYNKLYSGSTSIARNTSNTIVTTKVGNNSVYIYRTAQYKKAVIKDTYYFDGGLTDVEQFPVYHTVEIFNGTGLTYLYEVQKLVYSGPALTLKENSMTFGRNMKVEWDKGFSSATLSKAGKLDVKYKINSPYQKFNVRLFDPWSGHTNSTPGVDINNIDEFIHYLPSETLGGSTPDAVFSMNDDFNNTNITSEENMRDYSAFNAGPSTLSYVEYHTDSRDSAHNAWYDGYLRMGENYNNLVIPNGTILINPTSTWTFGGEFSFLSNNNLLMGKPNSASSGSNMYLTIGSNSKFSCNCLNSSGVSVGISGTTVATLDNSWYNLTCVYNGTNILQYVNQSLDGVSANVICNSSYNSSFGIGTSIGTSGTVHHGNVRNTFYYRRELNSTEIIDPYQADSTDLIFKIPLNDTNGRTAVDYSGNGYDATLRHFSRPVWIYNASDGFEGRFVYPSYDYSVTDFGYGSISIPIKTGSNPRANISDNFTVSNWFNIPSASNNGGFFLYGMYSMRMSSSNRPIIVIYLANGSALPTLSSVTCGSGANTWNNMILLYENSSRAGIYCNNVKRHNITYGGPVLQTGNVLGIGAVAGGTATQPQGSISEFKIFDRVLSEAEMTDISDIDNLNNKNIYYPDGTMGGNLSVNYTVVWPFPFNQTIFNDSSVLVNMSPNITTNYTFYFRIPKYAVVNSMNVTVGAG